MVTVTSVSQIVAAAVCRLKVASKNNGFKIHPSPSGKP
jgi:hypothetical protein